GPAIEVGDHGRVGLVIANQYLVGERSDALGYRQQLASTQVVAVNGVLAEDHPRLAFLHTSEDGFQPFTGIGPGALRMGVVGAEDEAIHADVVAHGDFLDLRGGGGDVAVAAEILPGAVGDANPGFGHAGVQIGEGR